MIGLLLLNECLSLTLIPSKSHSICLCLFFGCCFRIVRLVQQEQDMNIGRYTASQVISKENRLG